MKRNLSDMDSDCDDVFADEASKGVATPSSESCQLLNRKRRRGIIEKRRRDRINHSLSELRRLVPAAFEKQGSAKLEKAEILQLAVDHLKMMHSKGFDALSFDPHKFALDYHSIGFRECASEVARYLVTIEGMDLQNPLRLRLMSHLQCYSAQRELALKTAGVHNPWNPAGTFASVPPPTMAAPPPPPPSNAIYTNSMTSPPHSEAQYNCAENRLAHLSPMDNSMNGRTMQTMQTVHQGHHTGMGNTNLQMGHPVSDPMASLGQMNPSPSQHHLSGHGFVPTGYGNQVQQGSTVKPYRPWGAELAY